MSIKLQYDKVFIVLTKGLYTVNHILSVTGVQRVDFVRKWTNGKQEDKDKHVVHADKASNNIFFM